MSDIPGARNRLEQIAADLAAGSLTPWKASRMIRSTLSLLVRSPPVRRARVRRRPVSPDLCEEIRAYAAANPGAQMFEIAVKFNVNQGRVSEILNGLR
jgi:hypothetical protein